MYQVRCGLSEDSSVSVAGGRPETCCLLSNKTPLPYLVVFDSTTCTILLYLTQRGCRNLRLSLVGNIAGVLFVWNMAVALSLMDCIPQGRFILFATIGRYFDTASQPTLFLRTKN